MSKTTEMQKMVAGEFYWPGDAEITEQRNKTHLRCREISELPELDFKTRMEKFKEVFGKMGKDCFIENYFKCDYGFTITVGDAFYCNFDCLMLDDAGIEIGDYVWLAPGVHIYTVNHPLPAALRLTFLQQAKKVVIHDNVWIGGKCVICPGVTIGKNAVIGAGSVVIKDIPENALAVGNPAKVIKYIEQNVTPEQKRLFMDEHGIPENVTIV